MLDSSRIQLDQLIYSDASGTSQVFAGTYRPVEPDGREKETRVAVKCMEMPAVHTEFFNGLMQELTIQMKLEECPYVCKCYGYYTDNSRVCIVMEFLESTERYLMHLLSNLDNRNQRYFSNFLCLTKLAEN